jgi:A/G-specific adenine glycosylase
VREALLSWFDENARDLPWRRTRDPWRILVSEVMLQQIQVKRAMNLHRTARIVVEDHGGEVPSDPDVLLKLPGIGPSTAGAVACFAYERDVSFGTVATTNPHLSLFVSGSSGGSKR